jgi:hypothetical protein
MHCPDCGQKQVSEETRFCSRCGLPLQLISEVVAHRGTLPQLAELQKKKKKPILTRTAGIFIGISWILFFVLVATVFLDAMRAPGEIVSITAVFGIFTGVMMIVGSAMFLESGSDNSERKDDLQERRFREPANQSALPPQSFNPVQNYSQPVKGRWETNDLVQPSVTEGTTKLLRDDE